MAKNMKNKVLDVNDLHVSFDTYAGEVQAVRGVTFQLHEGEVLAIVGESGCGKSVTAQTIMKLNPMPPARIPQGEVHLGEHDIVKASEKEMQQLRGKEVSMIFQDPMTCLNPTKQVGKQIVEAIRHHQHLSAKEAKEQAIKYLKLVNIPNAEERAKQYPHEFSGGMRQRAMIAMALSCNPKVLIADEPTTALDVTIQAQIMDLLAKLKEEVGCSIVLITHDLGVVAANADRIAVMYAGQVVESGTADQIFYHCAHPYTRGLLESIPRLNAAHDARLTYIGGTPPDALNPAPGCAFSARCKYAMRICRQQAPEKREVQPGHFCSCFLMDDEAEDTRKKTGWEVSL